MDPLKIKSKPRKRLIVYAREHAQRNSYKFTLSCLWKAVEEGLFTSSWDIFGIGGHDGMAHVSNLGNRDVTLYNVNHMNLDDYLNFIQTGDIGLSIMTTPHPSLPPFDFAAAGMLVVTNNMHTREISDYTNISHNFFVGKTNIPAIVEQLRLAIKKVDDMDYRMAGSHFNNIPESTVDVKVIARTLADLTTPGTV